MFLCTLSVLVYLVVVANSNPRLGQIESWIVREFYEVPQDIKNLVPVDFAADNLHKSRLKTQNERNLLPSTQNVPRVSRVPIDATSRRFRSTKSPNDRSNEANRKVGKSSGKRRNKAKFGATKKPPRFHADDLSNYYHSTAIVEKTTAVPTKITANFRHGNSRFRMHSKNSSNRPSYRKSEDSIASIKKAINALPQQMVKVVKDDSVDCNENPTRKSNDTSGPPCALSVRWRKSGGDPWFSMSNILSRKWGLLRN